MVGLSKILHSTCFFCILLPAIAKSQLFEDCQQVIPPFPWGGIDVEHEMLSNVEVTSSTYPPIELCFGTGNFATFPNIHLGSHSGVGPCGVNPFNYQLSFSQPIVSLSCMILIGNKEDFVFESECSEIYISKYLGCNTEIYGDSIFLGNPIDNFGAGGVWFQVNFLKPVHSFSIRGGGEGCGSGFKICANSLNQAPLWAGVYGSEVVCGSGSLIFERYGWLAGPYTYTYTINGGAPQTFVTNETLAEIPLSELFGGEPPPGQYTIELTEIKDGSGWPVALSCNTSHTFEVVQQPVAQFTASPSSGVAPLEVNLQNQSSNATSYAWFVNESGGFDSAQPPFSTAENPVLTLN